MFDRYSELQVHPGDPCLHCKDGIDWRGGEPKKCLKYYGAGRVLTEDEKLKLQLNHTLNLPGGGESVKTSDAYTAAELEARFLAERGISARPGIKGHELPIPVVDAERELDHTLPGADESVKTSDAAAELEQAETAVSSETPAELEARFLGAGDQRPAQCVSLPGR